MKILWHFDSGVSQPFGISDDEITFDLRSGQKVLNVIIQDAPVHLKVNLLVDEKGAGFLIGQGLLVSETGEMFTSIPLEKVQEGVLSAGLSVRGKEIRIATRYPYGRDALDRLICDTYHTDHANLRILYQQHRIVPIFDFGQDNGEKWHHYFIAGEDAWETAGSWVADSLF